MLYCTRDPTLLGSPAFALQGLFYARLEWTLLGRAYIVELSGQRSDGVEWAPLVSARIDLVGLILGG